MTVEAPAREFFAEVRRAHGRIEELTRQIEWGFPVAHSDGPGSPGYKADPIGARVAEVMDRTAESKRELEQKEALVGEALEVCSGVRSHLGDVYGAVLECYYVDAMTWDEVPAACGHKILGLVPLTKGAAYYRARIALDYVDSVGIERAKRGETP